MVNQITRSSQLIVLQRHVNGRHLYFRRLNIFAVKVSIVQLIDERILDVKILKVRQVEQLLYRPAVKGEHLDHVSLAQLHETLKEYVMPWLHIDQLQDVKLLPTKEDALKEKQLSQGQRMYSQLKNVPKRRFIVLICLLLHNCDRQPHFGLSKLKVI